MNHLNVFSEIGKLKTVLLHEPGEELENLTPKYLDDLLFDDIPWLPLAKKEHQAFAKAFKDAGVKVVYLVDLVTESLNTSEDIKKEFIKQFIDEAKISSETLREIAVKYLESIPDTKTMVLKTMAGIKKKELPEKKIRTLSDYVSDYPFITDPLPNLYFTRDPFSIINDGVSLNRMFSITRCRETIYGEYIFKYHPIYKNNRLFYNRYMDTSIEGGDILVLNDETLKLINGEGKYTIFPFTASQLLGPFTDFDYLIKLLGNEKLTSTLNEEEFKEQFRKIHSMFLENKQFVNDIYTDIHKNIENINQEVREKTYKYLYCQK